MGALLLFFAGVGHIARPRLRCSQGEGSAPSPWDQAARAKRQVGELSGLAYTRGLRPPPGEGGRYDVPHSFLNPKSRIASAKRAGQGASAGFALSPNHPPSSGISGVPTNRCPPVLIAPPLPGFPRACVEQDYLRGDAVLLDLE